MATAAPFGHGPHSRRGLLHVAPYVARGAGATDPMMPLAPSDLDRLARVLALLGSPYPGERDAAALAADRMVRGKGLAWLDVLGGCSPPAVAPPCGWAADLALCRTHMGALNAWEADFVACVAARGARMSAAQRAKLAQVAAGLRAG